MQVVRRCPRAAAAAQQPGRAKNRARPMCMTLAGVTVAVQAHPNHHQTRCRPTHVSLAHLQFPQFGNSREDMYGMQVSRVRLITHCVHTPRIRHTHSTHSELARNSSHYLGCALAWETIPDFYGSTFTGAWR